MKNILIVVLSEISSGELTIAYEFGSRLDKNKCNVKYLIHPKFETSLSENGQDYFIMDINAGAAVNKRKADELIRSFKPDYILLSDIYTIEYSRLWSGVSMNFFKNYRIPILGIDEYEYLSTNCKIDYYGGQVEILPPLLTACDYIIRYCPLNKIIKNHASNIKLFSLYDRNLEISQFSKSEVRKELGIDDDSKLIVYTTSAWENNNLHSIPALGILTKKMPEILYNYICDLDEKIVILHIGPDKWNVPKNDQVRYINFSNLIPTKFDDYLLSADLFITTNIVSVTLSKAIFGGVPCVVFQNYKIINFSTLSKALVSKPVWYQEIAKEIRMVYPFRAGYFSWFRFLESVLKDNEYRETFVEAQLFKYDEVINYLKMYLYNMKEIQLLKQRQKKYIDKVLNLTTPQQIIDSMDVELCKLQT